MDRWHPTIKGIFVKSHIKAVQRKKGKAAVKELERRVGHPINYRNTDEVPISEEITIIEQALQLVSDTSILKERIAFEAGRFHFRNFATTPLARLVIHSFRDPKLLLKAKYIAEHVFRGVIFFADERGPRKVKVVMEGGQYPLDHFKGFFSAWIEYCGFKPKIAATRYEPDRYEYNIEW